MKVASFDVFDTVLTRAVGKPTSVFLLLGRRLGGMGLIRCTPEAFARQRAEAERRSRRRAAGMETTFDRLYAELAASLGLTLEQRDRVMAEELRLERELLRVVPGVREDIETTRRQGSRIVFLSDMYLPREVLISFLTAHDIWREGDDCLVSAEHRKNKTSGGLFRELLRREGVRPADVSHVGNQWSADVKRPRALGLKAVHFDSGNLNRYEEILEAYVWQTEGLSSALAGASRHARLNVHAEGPHEVAIRNVAAGVAAPLLTGYVLWLLHQARALGLRRLYFVARDGQILLDLARRFAPRLGVTCELRYLYGSRQAWHLPATTEFTEAQHAWLFEMSPFVSVRSLLVRVALAPEELEKELSGIGLPPREWARNLSATERAETTALLKSPPVASRIVERASEARGLLTEYLRQEGVLDGPAWGIVDVGWRGRLQNSLATVVALAGGVLPVGFYYALTATGSGLERGERHCYLYDHRQDFGYVLDGLPLAVPIELFCTADHGVVLSYERAGDTIRPVLREGCNRIADQWGLTLYQQTLRTFADQLVLDGDLVNPRADLRVPLLELLRSFWLTPTSAEAAAWGRFDFEDDQAGDSQHRLAAPFSLGQLPSMCWQGGIKPRYSVEWIQGSLAVTSRPVRLALRAAVGLGCKLAGLARRLRRLTGALLFPKTECRH